MKNGRNISTQIEGRRKKQLINQRIKIWRKIWKKVKWKKSKENKNEKRRKYKEKKKTKVKSMKVKKETENSRFELREEKIIKKKTF